MQHDGLPGSGGNVSGGPSILQPSLVLPSFLAFLSVATLVLSSSYITFKNGGIGSTKDNTIYFSKQQEEEEEEEEEEGAKR